MMPQRRTSDGPTTFASLDAQELPVVREYSAGGLIFDDQNRVAIIARHSLFLIHIYDDDPDHLMSYLSNIYAEDFQPGELSNYEPVSNAKLEKQAVKAGVSEDVAAAAFSGKNEYLDWLTASNNYTILRPELFNSSGAFSSPTLTINGEYWDLKQLTLADTNMVDGFLKSIGLDADQVGEMCIRDSGKYVSS